MTGLGNQLPDLGGAGRVSVINWAVVPSNAVDLLPGGLVNPRAEAHLRLVDVPKATAFLVPLEPKQLRTLQEQLTELGFGA